MVRKLKDKIIIGTDSQESYGNIQENFINSKLKKIDNDIYIASAGDAHVGSMLYAYAEKYSLRDIITNIELIEYFASFSSWTKKILYMGEEDIDPIANCELIIIIKNRVWLFINYYIRELDENNYSSIGSGSQTALACTKLSDSIEDILKATCTTNVHCSLPLNLLEIPI